MEELQKPQDDSKKGKADEKARPAGKFRKWLLAGAVIATLGLPATANCSLFVQPQRIGQTDSGPDADVQEDADTEHDADADADRDAEIDGDPEDADIADVEIETDAEADTEADVEDADADESTDAEAEADVEDADADEIELCVGLADTTDTGWVNTSTPLVIGGFRFYYGGLGGIDGIVLNVHCAADDMPIRSGVIFEDVAGGFSVDFPSQRKRITIEIHQKNDFAAHITVTISSL